MTDRSLFPEGVEVHQRHLENESTQRATDAARVFTLASEVGVVSGLVVSVNGGDPTKIDVSAGTAYSPAGSFMALSAGRTGVTLASSVLSTQNYVCLVYDELQSDQEAHRSDGTLRYTKTTNAPRVVVLTAAAYAALPTSNTVLSANAKDRIAILAVVTATGGALSASDIASPPAYSPVLTASVQSSLSGVIPLQVGAGTSAGTGSLTWNFGASTLTWTAPGETAGAPVTIGASQAYTLTSGSGTTLRVDIALSVLPVTTTTASVTIVDVYSHTASRLSLKDAQHRSLLGSGIPAINNPHGMTLDDLSPGAAGSLEEHQDIMHTDGIGRGSSTSALLVTVNTAGAPDSMSVSGFLTGDSAYINGRRVTGITGSTTISAPSTASMTTEQIYLSQDGVLGRRTLATFGTLLLGGYVQILDVAGNSSNTCRLQFTTAGQIAFDPGDGTFGPFQAAPSVDNVVRVYGRNQLQYVDLWARSGVLPGATVTDTVTVTQPAPADAILVLANVPWSGSASGFLGYGFGIGNSPNRVYDRRTRGTLDITNVNDRSGIGRDAARARASMTDGLIIDVNLPSGTTDNQLTYTSALAYQHAYTVTGLTYTYNGGKAIIGGQLIDVPFSSGSLTDNATNRLYVGSDGTVGVSTSSWSTIASSQAGRPYLQLAQVVELAGVPTTTDLRSFTGYRRDQPTGVVGLDTSGGATIAPIAGQGLIVNAAAGSDAIVGNGNAVGVGNAGVHGTTTNNAGYGVLGENSAGIGIQARSTGAGTSALEAASTGGTGIYVTGGSDGGFGSPGLESTGGAGASGDGAGLVGNGGGTTGSGVVGVGATVNSYGLESTSGHVGVQGSRDYKYTTAKTGTLVIGASNLAPTTATASNITLARIATFPPHVATVSGAFPIGWIAQLHVPRGSIIQNISALYTKSNIGVLAGHIAIGVFSYDSSNTLRTHVAGSISIGNAGVAVSAVTKTASLAMTDFTPQSTASSTVSYGECFATIDIAVPDTAVKLYGFVIEYTCTLAGAII